MNRSVRSPGAASLAVLASAGGEAMRPEDRHPGGRRLHIDGKALALLAFGCAVALGIADAQAGPGSESALLVIARWTPLLLAGFGFNILISLMAMSIGTVLGVMLGLIQMSTRRPLALSGWAVTQFFRNAPWLVLLFYCMYLMPFEFNIFGRVIPFPDWAKATLGLSLPVMANVSEIVRGAVNSIHATQWEAADALGFTHLQRLRHVIFPQCIKRMLPPWMNLYALLVMGTVLTSIVGVGEVMTLTRRVLASESRPDLLIPIYAFVLLWFFAFCYPIARLTAVLERRYQVIT